jgi:preprotein translocase subunit SecE
MSAQRRSSARGDAVATASSSKAEKRTRAAKPKGEAPKQNIIAVRTERLRGFVQDTTSEMKKINWPDQETTRNLTIVVIGISVALGILLGGIDFLLIKLLGLF